MRFSTRSIAAVATAGALALAVPALAQDDAPPTDDQQQPSEQAGPHESKRQRLAAALADELGLPVEDVEAALEAVHDRFREEREAARLEALRDRLDAAVAEGDLTQEQADAIYAAAEAGVFPRAGHRGHRGPRHHAPPGLAPPGSDRAPDAESTTAT